MALAKVDSGAISTDLTTYTISPVACTSGRLHVLTLRTSDAGGQRTLSSASGTNGFSVTPAVQATSAPASRFGGVHVLTLVPSSSTPGDISLVFSGGCTELVWELLDWDDGDTTTPCPSAVATNNGGAAEASSVTHGAMADATNNVLISLLHIGGASSAHTKDANYSVFDASPLAGESGYFWVQHIVGGADLTCNTTWTTNRVWAALTIEIAKATSGIPAGVLAAILEDEGD